MTLYKHYWPQQNSQPQWLLGGLLCYGYTCTIYNKLFTINSLPLKSKCVQTEPLAWTASKMMNKYPNCETEFLNSIFFFYCHQYLNKGISKAASSERKLSAQQTLTLPINDKQGKQMNTRQLPPDSTMSSYMQSISHSFRWFMDLLASAITSVDRRTRISARMPSCWSIRQPFSY